MKRSRNHRAHGKRGYRLHDERIAYSGGTDSMRTVKFELKDSNGVSGTKDKIANAIVHDTLELFGNVNLNDYLGWRTNISDNLIEKGYRESSFLGLWVKAVSLGFVLSNKIDLDLKRVLGIKSEQEYLFESIPTEIQPLLDREKWISWYKTDVRTSPKSKKSPEEQIKDKIITLFLEESRNSSLALEKAQCFWDAGVQQNSSTFRKQLFGIQDGTEGTKDNEKKAPLFFACHPRFSLAKEVNDWTEILDRVIDYWSGHADETTAKRLLGIGENGNHFNNGLFGKFFETVRGESELLQQLASRIGSTFEYNKEETNEIYKRLLTLKEYALTLPLSPKLVSKWSDYRSVFNGTIESWYSNRERNRKDALNQFFGKEERNPETGEVIPGTAGINVYLDKLKDSLPDACEIKQGILSETISYIETLGNDPKKLTKQFTDQLNNYYLPTLRDELNEWSQQDQPNQNIKEDGTPSKNFELLPKNWFKSLKKNVQKMPLFFGENKRLQWEQIYSLKELIHSEFAKLESVLQEEFIDNDITEKQIDMLAELFNRIKDEDNNKVKSRLEFIARELELNFSDKTDKAKYYLSGFERGKYTLLKTPMRITISKLLSLANLPELYQEAKTIPQSNNILRDTVQLSKIVLSATLVGKEKQIQRDIVLSHSNLQGYSSLISKKNFISRYSVQSTNGGQCVLSLGYGSSKKNPEHILERYFYAFPCVAENSGDSHQKLELTKILKENAHTPEKLTEPIKVNGTSQKFFSLQVHSSRYQVQFLDWFFNKHSKKKTTLMVGGAFSIVEKELEVNWGNSHPICHEIVDPRVFVSQPFTLLPPRTPEIKSANYQNRYIGVDIGEYGLAWSLIEVKNNHAIELESGFIADKQQQTLKSDVRSWRQNQVRQTFTSPDTKIARLRESLIGSYKNQLESLALKKQATLSFEYEVSGFEVGGQRVAKIYDSIKRGVVRKKENNPQNNQTWGKRGEYNWAFETTASGTSQLCSKCKRWSSLAIEEYKEYELCEYDDKLFKVNLGDGEVRLLGKENMQIGSTLKGKDLKGLIYKAMRPNIDGVGMRIVGRVLGENKFNEMKLTFGKDKERGNMGIFVCPYTDCHHIADADLQAAFNIAIRGYLRDSAPMNLRSKDGKIKQGVLTKEYLTNAAKELSYSPIGI